MLKIFRQKGVSKIVLWLISGIIILSFALGASISSFSEGQKTQKTAGKIFGRKVSVKIFQKEYLNVRDQVILNYGANAEKILPFLDLEQETWTRLMLLAEAKTKEIKVSNQELIAWIQSIPSFQKDGHFDPRYYDLLLKNIFQRSAKLFEEGLRGQLTIAKMFQTITQHIFVKNEDIEQSFLEYYKNIQLAYISLNTDEIENKMSIADEDIQQYYQDNIQDFQDQTWEQARPIIEMSLKNTRALDIKYQEAQQIHQQISDSLSQNIDFQEAAKKQNLAISITEVFSLQNPPEILKTQPELLTHISQLNKEQALSPILQTEFGFMIAYLKSEEQPDLSALTDAIKKDLEKKLYENRRMAIMQDFLNDVKMRARLENFLAQEQTK